MKLSTTHIFLDTNIYEEHNFFHSTKIQSLFHYSKNGVITLHMTTISYLELLNRMKKRLNELKVEHNKLVNSLNSKNHWILKNLTKYENLKKTSLTVEESMVELKEKLDTIIKISKINIITAEDVNADDVFKLYYNNEAPFNEIENKKYEFPDAFIIKSIDAWCKKNKTKILFLTRDKDFIRYRSRSIIYADELTNLLVEITKLHDSRNKQLIPFIASTLNQNELLLLENINEEIDSFVSLDVDYEKTSNLKRSKPKLRDYKIISIRSNYAEVIYNVEINYKFTIFPSSIDLERTVFEDNIKPVNIVKKLIIQCDLEVGLYKENEVKLKWINSNQRIKLNVE